MIIQLYDKEFYLPHNKLSYYDAILYCQLLDIDGKNDWRLASYKDMGIVFEYGKLYESGYCILDDNDEYNCCLVFQDEMQLTYLNPDRLNFDYVAVRDI